jgi:uncharacterized protein YndB with AHSA1/START domain
MHQTSVQHTVTHNTFVIERVYPVSPSRVFAAWTTQQAKAQWFGGPAEWGPDEHTLDFRVGGHESSRGGPPGGPVHLYEATYQDIVPDQRMVYTYAMYIDGTRISLSLATVELLNEGQATRLIYTEQGAYLDGYDTPAEREHGSGVLLDALGKVLQSLESTKGNHA